jgi:hypothetical protein
MILTGKIEKRKFHALKVRTAKNIKPEEREKKKDL